MAAESVRSVYVRARVGDGRKVFGSGFLVAPSLVLTSAHVVDDVGHEVVVGWAGQESAGTVVWRHRSGAVDAALIRVPGAGEGLGRRPMRWGRLTSTRPRVPCQATGYPRAQREESGRWEEQLSGHVNPGTAASAGRYEIHVDDSLPRLGAPGESPWAGMSGAAVLSADGRLVIGVVSQDRTAYGGRLAATRAQDLLADPGFHDLIRDATGCVPLLESVELAGLLDTPQVRADLRSPAFLLRADAEVVAFRGRRELLEELAGWCEGDGVSVRLLAGPGGQGKTRLSRRLLNDMYGRGFVGGHLLSRRVDPAAYAVFAQTTVPLIVVVDYAESRPEQVVHLLEQVLHGGDGQTVRILLVARTAGEWWTQLRTGHPDLEAALSGTVVQTLQPLEPDEGGRRAAFGDALRDLAAHLERIPGFGGPSWASAAKAIDPPTWLGADVRASILTIQMAALVELLQSGEHPVEVQASDAVEDVLLNHERRYWQRTAVAAGLALNPKSLERAIAAAALCGADDAAQAGATLEAVPGWDGTDADRREAAAGWIHGLYPAPAGEYWGALQPDRIGEHLVATVTRDTPELLNVLLPAATVEQRQRALEVLARASAREQDHFRPIFRSLLGMRHWHLIVTMLDITTHAERPEALRAALASFVEEEQNLAYGELLALTMATPLSTLVLRDFGVRVAERLVMVAREKARRATMTDRLWPFRVPKRHRGVVSDLATALAYLAERYLVVNRREEAVAAAEESVGVNRRLGRDHALGLADALRVFANACPPWRQEAALAAAEEAVGLQRRHMDDAEPGSFEREHRESELAHALVTLSTLYERAGRAAESVAASEEATAIEHRLAEIDPDNHVPRLVSTLTTAASSRAGMGRHDDVVERAERAVALLHDLAAVSPDLHLNSLATELNNLSNAYGNAGRPEEALAAVQEAVAVFRRLAAAHPGRRPDSSTSAHDGRGLDSLATALANNAIRYALLDRHAEGLAPIEEAIAIRGGGTGEPEKLAHCLSLRGGLLVECGRPVEAIEPLLQSLHLLIELEAETRAAAMWLRAAGEADPEGVSAEWRRLTGEEADWTGIS
ncbi:tetratricopeptide repeat-containing serine protease family protein [Nonomuraea sp. NPDC005501]|uniref:tetratricopeptide repeat-containing serine protease family protein n=1 Tax=Nonomuraea sp. NPDC005501 TaxID=3156884 RepID=UPI0033BF9FD2